MVRLLGCRSDCRKASMMDLGWGPVNGRDGSIVVDSSPGMIHTQQDRGAVMPP